MIKKLLISILVLLLIFPQMGYSTTPPQSITTKTSTILDDAFVSVYTGTGTNYGAREILMDNALRDHLTYIWVKFDISNLPPGVVIDNASLYLYKRKSGGSEYSSNTVTAYSSTDHTWSEDTITGKTQPSLDMEQGSIITHNDKNIWYTWDVTGAVRNSYNAKSGKVSLSLQPTSRSGATTINEYNSKEYVGDPTLRPYLEITHHSPPITVAPTTTAAPTTTPPPLIQAPIISPHPTTINIPHSTNLPVTTLPLTTTPTQTPNFPKIPSNILVPIILFISAVVAVYYIAGKNAGESLAISLIVTTIAFFTNNGSLKLLNMIAWSITAYFFYGGLFLRVNRIDLSDDLQWILVRVIGGIISLVGFLMGSWFFVFGAAKNFDPFTMGISIIFLGLGFLGSFMLFRVKRRYQHIYVNR